ncbi:DUF2029 domain-containing protein [Telmatocola sphagniphila]|uniref:DUF2029 domain-containing protein n=1 Tax=Telmatocola sphagniphila TaxID=1123043 RepID=A0A8E6B896_9BACT|nr:glycosyltransferase family 87 protein [Telmatocola sphagniphila]QVL33718.1 DUF2029 domain-containing protein [Telmatocola sphagniphila]
MRFALLFALILGLGIWLFNEYLQREDVFVPIDTIEYWGAAKLLIAGQNPYDPALLLQTEQTQDPRLGKAVMLWNPPWSLAWITPLGYLPFKFAVLLWMIGILIAIFWSTYLLSRQYVPVPPLWLPLLFAPSYFLLAWGQFTGLVLLGLSAFVWAMRREKPYLAGIAFSLTAIKPHLLLLVGLGVALRCYRSHYYRKVVCSSLVTLAVLSAFLLLFRPYLWSDYQTSLALKASAQHDTLRDWENPTLSYWLRITVAPEQFWVQFVPVSIAGFVVLIFYAWGRYQPRLDHLPVGVLLSVILSPYGAWPFDLVLLLIPLLQAAYLWKSGPTSLGRTLLFFSFLLSQAAVLLRWNWFHVEFLWYPLLMGLLYGLTRALNRPSTDRVPT